MASIKAMNGQKKILQNCPDILNKHDLLVVWEMMVAIKNLLEIRYSRCFRLGFTKVFRKDF